MQTVVTYTYDFPETVDIKNRYDQFWAIKVRVMRYDESHNTIFVEGSQIPNSGKFRLDFPVNIKLFTIVCATGEFKKHYQELLRLCRKPTPQAANRQTPDGPKPVLSENAHQPTEVTDFDLRLQRILAEEKVRKTALEALARATWAQ